MKKNLRLILFSSVLTAMSFLMMISVSAQLLPDGDISAGSWTTSPLWSKLDDIGSANISSPNNAQTSGEVSIQNLSNTATYASITLRVIAGKGSNGGAERGLNANLRINGNLLTAQTVQSSLTGTLTEYTVTWNGIFSSADINTLEVVFTTTGITSGGGGSLRTVVIDFLEIQLPTPIPLPVKLKSFTASRKQANVELSWVTAMEQNNSGFEVQRQAGAGGWQTIGFVASKSEDGNSNGELTYQYADANNSKGVSQYRLKQVDLDNKFEYSQVRAVHGMSQSGRTLVAPNPSNGSLNVLFESAGQRDLLLTDMAGRIMRQWNNYNDNSVQISNLAPGSYQLRIIDRETKSQSVEKIMVVNR